MTGLSENSLGIVGRSKSIPKFTLVAQAFFLAIGNGPELTSAFDGNDDGVFLRRKTEEHGGYGGGISGIRIAMPHHTLDSDLEIQQAQGVIDTFAWMNLEDVEDIADNDLVFSYSPSKPPVPKSLCSDTPGFYAMISRRKVTCDIIGGQIKEVIYMICETMTTYRYKTQAIKHFCPEPCHFDCAPTQSPSESPFCKDDHHFMIFFSGRRIDCDVVSFQADDVKNLLCGRSVNYHNTEVQIQEVCPEACNSDCIPTNYPTNYPTNENTKKPTKIPTVAPTGSCVDDSSFDEIIEKRRLTCEILESYIPEVKELLCPRVVRVSDRRDGGGERPLKQICPEVCDFDCAPTTSPTKAPSTCTDDDEFDLTIRNERFTCNIVNYQTSDENKELLCNTEINREGYAGLVVREICPQACNNNCDPSQSPTSIIPSYFPTRNTLRPTLFPSTSLDPSLSPTSECIDDYNFDVVIDKRRVTCDRLLRSTEATKNDICSRPVVHQGIEKPIGQICPIACYNCAPTQSPTVNYTPYPSRRTPSRGPTAECADDPNFDTMVANRRVTCEVIVFHIPEVRALLCETFIEFDGDSRLGKQFCPNTCDFDCAPTVSPSISVPTKVPTVECVDDINFDAVIADRRVTCAFIQSQVQDVQNLICGRVVNYDGNTRLVKEICKDTCGGCIPTGSPTISFPTQVPTISGPTIVPTIECVDDKNFDAVIADRRVTCSIIQFNIPEVQVSLCETLIEFNGDSRLGKQFCPNTCKFDCAPTGSPSISFPTMVPTIECVDDINFDAIIANRRITCAFIQSQIQDVQELICGRSVNYDGNTRLVKEICKDTCGGCIPTGLPTISVPTQSPSTSVPTQVPTIECVDDINFDAVIADRRVTCSIIQFNIPEVQASLCETLIEFNGDTRLGKQFCPNTCNFDCAPTGSPSISFPTMVPTIECVDDINFDAIIADRRVTCAFIQSQIQDVQELICGRSVNYDGNTRLVKEICKDTCGGCIPTLSPTGSPTSPTQVPTMECVDDINFDAVIANRRVTCAFIQFQIQDIQDLICGRSVNYDGNTRLVKEICKDTCGRCIPTQIPTISGPTIVPTIECADDENFSGETTRGRVTCADIRFQIQDVRDMLCMNTVNYNGNTRRVEQICQRACNFENCVPSTPTIAPTTVPTTAPLRVPTIAPTKAPSSCEDDINFDEIVAGRRITCNILADETGQIRDIICTLTAQSGQPISSACPITCGNSCVPTPSPTVCQDDTNFDEIVAGRRITCNILADQTGQVRGIICTLAAQSNTRRVEQICQRACNFENCVPSAPTKAPSTAPTTAPLRVPTIAPTKAPSSPTVCQDDINFDDVVAGRSITCNILAAQTGQVRGVTCTLAAQSGQPISSACPITCGNNCAPTPSPTVCQNDTNFDEIVAGRRITCNILAAQTGEVRDIICTLPAQSGQSISSVCPITCGNNCAPTPSPTVCQNDINFDEIVAGRRITCNILAAQTGQVRGVICALTTQSGLVSGACPITCGNPNCNPTTTCEDDVNLDEIVAGRRITCNILAVQTGQVKGTICTLSSQSGPISDACPLTCVNPKCAPPTTCQDDINFDDIVASRRITCNILAAQTVQASVIICTLTAQSGQLISGACPLTCGSC